MLLRLKDLLSSPHIVIGKRILNGRTKPLNSVSKLPGVLLELEDEKMEGKGQLGGLFERETVLNERTFGFKCGFSKDVLLMVGKAFRRLQGKGMRKGKATGARGALPEIYSTAR